MRIARYPLVGELLEGIAPVLVLLIVASTVLVVLSAGFATVALGGHLWTKARARSERRKRTGWRQALLAVLAGTTSPRSLVEQVERRDADAFLRFLVPYATTVRGDAARRLRAVARPFMPRVRRYLKADRPLVRAQAVQRIGLLGGREHLQALRNCLDDPSDRVVEMAVRRLAMVGSAGETERLLRALERLENVDRRQISSALVELGDAAAPVLRTTLADMDRSSFVRVCAAETLRWLGDGGAAPVAARLLRNALPWDEDNDPELVASLLRLLRRVGQAAHADLVRPLCRVPVAFVRIHAARALGQLGTGDDEALLSSLVSEDDSRWVALAAAQSLVELDRMAPLRRLRESDHSRAELATDLLPASA